MDPGKLDRIITIEKPPEIPERDETGAPRETFVTAARPWARVTTLRGSEDFAAGAETQKHTAVFRIRYRPGITPEMRIVHNGRPYDIEDIAEPDGLRHKYLDITATGREIKSGG